MDDGIENYKKDVSVNSIVLNAIKNRQRNISENKEGVLQGTAFKDKDNFIKKREQPIKDNDLRLSLNGKFICEKVNFATKDE